MRVSWHARERVFVVSHWKGLTCVGATRISVESAPELIGVLVSGLAESAALQESTPAVAVPDSIWRRWRDRLTRRRVRPVLAEVRQLASRRDPPSVDDRSA
ncbi:MAG: hypothetical protein JWN46_470 [Acidimicrobiales bacterium]|nr:hypothetical protein [Acidimicrobiales bacterium]